MVNLNELSQIGKNNSNFIMKAGTHNPIAKVKGALKSGLQKDIIEIKDKYSLHSNIIAEHSGLRLKPYTGELLKIDLPLEVKPEEIRKIQRGRRGVIRPNSELSTKEISTVIRYQQEAFSPEYIEGLLQSFPKEERAMAEEVLTRLTQFGNYDSLPKITEQLPKILEDRLTGLGSTIRYLSKHEGAFPKKPIFVQTGGEFIVDRIFLERIEHDKNYLREILEKNPDFVIPEGTINGINPFNQTENIEQLLRTFTERAKAVKKQHPEISDSQAVGVALNMPIIKKLRALGIQKTPRIIQNPSVKEQGLSVSEKIAKQLNGEIVSQETLDKIISEYPPEQRQYVLEILANTLNTKSTKTLSEKLREIHKIILKTNKGKEEGIYYVIPQDVKSYTLATTQYQLTNGVHPSKVIRLEDLAATLPKDATTIVVLDDLAGSGSSLETAYGAIIDELEKIDGNKVGDVFLAPILSTPEALEKLNGISKGKYRCTCVPSEITRGLTRSDYYASLLPEQKEMFRSVVGRSGFDGGCLSVAFPYMAPDNNSELFASRFASLFTLNGSGVKGKSKLTDAELKVSHK